MFAEDGTRWPSLGLGLIARELRGMYEIRQFRLGYCLETTGHLMSDHLRALTQSTQAEVADGYYDFLPSPPVVFSRALSQHNRFVSDRDRDRYM